MIAVAIAAYISNGFDNETTLDVLLEGAWLFLFAASVVFGLMLFVWILVDIVCKHDPLYDWFAGTAVVHV